MKGQVIWITGMPGSGKTTLAKALQQITQEHQPVLLDGDKLRQALNNHDYSLAGRKALSQQYAGLAHMLAEQGHLVIVSVVAMYREVHAWNRANMTRYTEVLLKPSSEVLIQRNKKGLYLPGSDFHQSHTEQDQLKIEYPLSPEIIFDSGSQTPENMAKELLEYLNQQDAGKSQYAR
ncbi:adenylyl-sulfate kinase [Agarivorans sp. QJM3NY_33]|uniref:adenylyl-sulfate kinase n=1 Tax=Agarivorans sp. QJM3NY_33 TaxID=3421432 RepID=UPI003D7E00AA